MSDVTRERAKLMKFTRSTIRLYFSLKADDKIAEVLPRIVADFDKAIAAGKAFELDTMSLLDEIDDAV